MSGDSNSNTVKYYNNASWWGKSLDAANRERVKLTLDLIPSEVRTILDLGCGDGQVSNHLVQKGIKVIGTDISYVALQYFQGAKAIASADVLPFENDAFDLVLSSEVLEHLPEPIYQASLQEIERVAKRYVLISTPNEEYLPTAYVKCKGCSNIFHANLHVRSFNYGTHTSLFPGFVLKKADYVSQWRQVPSLTSARHFLGGYRFKEGVICPRCGEVQTGSPSSYHWIVNKGFDTLNKLLPQRYKARWLISLYQAS